MRRSVALPILIALIVSFVALPVFADAEYWEGAERELRLVLTEAYYRYISGDVEGAVGLVDVYFAEYQRTGFEEQVRAVISQERAQNIEDWVNYVKTSMMTGKSQQEIRESQNELLYLMRVTANRLDGKEEPVAVSRNWSKTAEEMAAVLDKAYTLYLSGDQKGAKDQVDVAYFQFYEKLGFEKMVLTSISGERASKTEYQFSAVKKYIIQGRPDAEVKEGLDMLAGFLKADAADLDSKTESALGVFLGSLLIILREGFEAILIVGAIIAYLIKSGNKKSTKPVYVGSIIALGFSVVMAWILNALTSTASGQNQEIIEGLTMLLAVVVLFYVSNWMVSKAEAEAWSTYIEGKVQRSMERGSVFSLAFAAFLAVFREGAETILFYQALLAGNRTYLSMIWVGLGVGSVLLVIIYILIRILSLKIPLKPFFLGTSILLFVMSITFIGNGVKELQEGDIVGVTSVPGIASIDLLGIYPTLETLIPQILLLIITVVTFIVQLRRSKSLAVAAM
jgi:high-affinity iron transporter